MIRGNGQSVQLSLLENIVFAKLALNPRIVISRESIYKALGKVNIPDQYDVESIKSIVFLLRRRIGDVSLGSRAGPFKYIQSISGIGYVWDPADILPKTQQ